MRCRHPGNEGFFFWSEHVLYTSADFSEWWVMIGIVKRRDLFTTKYGIEEGAEIYTQSK